MATITQKVCDRCGKPLGYNGWTAKIKNAFKRGKRVKITEYFNGNPDGYSYVNSEYEMCADCTRRLKIFLREKDLREEVEYLKPYYGGDQEPYVKLQDVLDVFDSNAK